jgi:hypothetical protein
VLLSLAIYLDDFATFFSADMERMNRNLRADAIDSVLWKVDRASLADKLRDFLGRSKQVPWWSIPILSPFPLKHLSYVQSDYLRHQSLDKDEARLLVAVLGSSKRALVGYG